MAAASTCSTSSIGRTTFTASRSAIRPRRWADGSARRSRRSMTSEASNSVWGVAGQVLSRLGVVPQQIPPGDIYPALEKGTIDAAEWIGPYDDEKLGFLKVAPYYYYPGWWEGCANGFLYINTAKWDELPKTYQHMVTIAAGQVAADLTAKYDARNAQAIKRLVAAGAQLRPFSTEILDASFKATNELFAEVSAKNEKFKKLYDSMIEFRNEQYQWDQVCEATYDNYMIRRIRS